MNNRDFATEVIIAVLWILMGCNARLPRFFSRAATSSTRLDRSLTVVLTDPSWDGLDDGKPGHGISDDALRRTPSLKSDVSSGVLKVSRHGR